MKKSAILLFILFAFQYLSAQIYTDPNPPQYTGIGTTSPAAKLHVQTPNGGTVLMGAETTYGLISLNGYKWDWNMISSATDKSLYFNRPLGYNMFFNVGNDYNQMTLSAGGNLGIGTSGPWDKLTVMGNVSSDDGNGGYVTLSGYDGGIEIGSGNDGLSFIDFKGKNNLSTDLQGRIDYEDNVGFDIATGGNGSSKVRIGVDGNVGIGTTDTKGYKLGVNGAAIFTKAVVKAYGNWADYVFDEHYKLPTLEEIEKYIKANHHLPDVPSADEVQKNGIDLGDNQALLLKKIEELTLFAIEQQKQMEVQQKEIKDLQVKLQAISLTKQN